MGKKKTIVSVTYENERIFKKTAYLSYNVCYVSPVWSTGRFIENTVYNGHNSARGPHNRDVTHISSKVSCFFFIEIRSFS